MAEQSPLPPHWEVPQKFRDRLGKEAGRQRAMHHDGHLLLVMHRPPEPEEVQRGGRYFWRRPDGAWASNELGSGTQALGRHLEEYAELVEQCDRQEEAAVTAEDYFSVLNRLGPIDRAAGHMHQVLQEARKLVPGDRDLLILRDRAYEIERTADLLYRQTRNSLDFAMARQAEEHAQSSHHMAVSSHRLNLLAAFFFPIAALTALFGVNLRHGLENEYAPWPFLIVLAIGLMFGFVLTSFVTFDPERTGVAKKARRDRRRAGTAREPDADRHSIRR